MLEEQQQIIDEMNGEGPRVAPDTAPVEFLQAIYRDHRQPMNRRMRAAIEAAPYVHPKLAATVLLNGEDFAQRLDKAIARSHGRLIEAQVEPEPGKIAGILRTQDERR